MICKYAEIFCWKNVSSFCSAKATHIFSAKNFRKLYIKSAKIVNEMALNELVKLTALWTTGPSYTITIYIFSGLYVWEVPVLVLYWLWFICARDPTLLSWMCQFTTDTNCRGSFHMRAALDHRCSHITVSYFSWRNYAVVTYWSDLA